MIWRTCQHLRDGTIVKGFETHNRYYYAPSGLQLMRRDAKNVYIKHGHGEIEALPLTTKFLIEG